MMLFTKFANESFSEAIMNHPAPFQKLSDIKEDLSIASDDNQLFEIFKLKPKDLMPSLRPEDYTLYATGEIICQGQVKISRIKA